MYTSRRVFDQPSHEQFARVSCDYNPIHMDAKAARRTHAGMPIIHGVHSLLWVLDCICASTISAPRTRSLKAQFLQPIYIDDEVRLEISAPTQKGIRARASVGSEEVISASIGFDEADHGSVLSSRRTQASAMKPPSVPANLSLEEMEGLTGALSFSPLNSQLAALFPHATRTFGLKRVAALACSSCLVGMVVPGLHSMYSGLDVSFSLENTHNTDELEFAVLSVAKRFRLVRIGISGPGLRGALETMNRMPPVRQPDIDRILNLMSKDEFRNSDALVIGGSRGLGELTAKILAAGGSRVTITYATGKAEADAVVAEIGRVGGRCIASAYDVHRAASEQLGTLDAPTHLYYFATPPIFRRKTGLFDCNRFAEFNLFYLTAFFDVVQTCSRLGRTGIRVFYPSSTALDARPATMTEYTMSKAAGEVLCTDLTKYVPSVTVLTHRLPRLPTDQTISVVQAETHDPLEVLLPILREMHR